jgi:hypothetical protein
MANEVKITDEMWIRAISINRQAGMKVALEDYEARRPKDGFTLEEIETAVIKLWNHLGPPDNGKSLNGIGFARHLREELAPKSKTPEERRLDVIEAFIRRPLCAPMGAAKNGSDTDAYWKDEAQKLNAALKEAENG